MGAPYSSLAGSPAQTLMGRPLIVTDHCQTMGTEGDVILFDPTQYALGMRREMGIETRVHEKFSSDIITWRMILRVGGAPLWNEAYTQANGSTTTSCIVILTDAA